MEVPASKLQFRPACATRRPATMYLDHYGLREPPFSITPDPRFVYLSERHRDALAHLLYGIGQGGGSGFVQLTGEVGTGKTTLSRLLLEQLPDNVRVALILNPLLSPVELLEAICEELHVAIEGKRGNLKALVDALNAFLLEAYASGLRIVLMIDEAQNLSATALEQIRLLTNLETSTQKLLQIILLGQPELRDQLARPDLRQLAQRITARYHLDPLNAAETEAYLRHRWAVAGGTRLPFLPSSIRLIYRRAGGIPRLLNVIAERALVAGYARGENPIGERLLNQAANEVLPSRPHSQRMRLTWSAIAFVLLALAAVAWRGWTNQPAAIAHVASVVPKKIERLPAAPKARAVAPIASEPLLDASAFTQRLVADNGSSQHAWTGLLALWSVRRGDNVDADTPSCKPTLSPGLFCATGNATLSLIAQFDRPALLTLRANGRTVSALLLGISSTEALLQVDARRFRIRRGVLERAMTGYTAILRGPNFVVVPIKRGDTGPGVAWLRDRFHGSLAGDGSIRYDDALASAVRRLQSDFGLHEDGVAGPETLLALMASEPAGPHLRKLSE